MKRYYMVCVDAPDNAFTSETIRDEIRSNLEYLSEALIVDVHILPPCFAPSTPDETDARAQTETAIAQLLRYSFEDIRNRTGSYNYRDLTAGPHGEQSIMTRSMFARVLDWMRARLPEGK